MEDLRAYCPDCGDPTPHTPIDAASCRCDRCGRVELYMVPRSTTSEAARVTLARAEQASTADAVVPGAA